MFHYILLVVLIVLLISIIYWVFRPTDSSKRKKSEDYLQRSAGTFDEMSQRALGELDKIENPTADDYFRRGQIIHYNLLEGNIHGGRTETAVRRRQRQATVGNIIRDYTDALIGMHGRTDEIGEERDLTPDFMIYHIEDLGHNLLTIEDDIIQQLILGFNDTVAVHAPVVRQELIDQRRAQAVAASNTRAEAIDKYFDSATKFTNDSQNVHDNKVNSDLRETLNKLMDTAPVNFNPLVSIDEADVFIHSDYSKDPVNGHKIQPALTTLGRVKRGDKISTFNESEDRIFGLVWERCKHPRNRARELLMKEAVINALADSVENGEQVCINGRCGRILNSLALLDFDKNVGSAMTFEAYKNQIFQETKEIISQEINRAKASTDPVLRSIGDAYETGQESDNPSAEAKFKEEVKVEIDRNINAYADKLSDTEIKNIKAECYVYATL